MTNNWILVGETDGPKGELVLVYQLPSGEYTYCVIGANVTEWASYRTRSWYDAVSHYARTCESPFSATFRARTTSPTEPMRCPFTDEQSTVRPVVSQ